MKRTKKHPYELSLLELLQEVQNRTSTETISTDQQQLITQTMMNILQVCAKRVERPLRGQDMQEVRGQAHVKRAMEVAAAGGHNTLLVGPAGAGKMMLVRTFPSLLPTSSVPYPFRVPPSSTSLPAFLGDVTVPGEFTLAHGGVMLLENLHAYDVPVLGALRRAVETHVIAILHEETRVMLPARFVLIATVQPCPCGWSGDPLRACSCSGEAIAQHQQRISDIVQTCFEIKVEVPMVQEDLLSKRAEESSAQIRSRVEAARDLQKRRYTESASLWVNADLGSLEEVQHYCQIDAASEKLLRAAFQQLHLAPLQVLQIQKVARTIADLAAAPMIRANHIAEAIRYRSSWLQ